MFIDRQPHLYSENPELNWRQQEVTSATKIIVDNSRGYFINPKKMVSIKYISRIENHHTPLNLIYTEVENPIIVVTFIVEYLRYQENMFQ